MADVGSSPHREPALAERRAFVRYASGREVSCRPAGKRQEAGWLGRLKDVSAGGIGLLMRHRFRAGTSLTVELIGLGPMSVRVVRVVPVSNVGEFAWLMGCVFVHPLTDTELTSLLS